jgi:hypothetical protein
VAGTRPPADETDLAVCRAVLAAAKRGDFDDLPPVDPVMVVRHSRIEKHRPLDIKGLPDQYGEAYDHWEARTESVDLGALTGEGVTASDTLDRYWAHCNVIFSQIGYNTTRDAAVVLFTCGCREGTQDFRQSYLTFLTRETGDWVIEKYLGQKRENSDAIGKLAEFFPDGPWDVPLEVFPVATEHLRSRKMLEAIFGKSDTTFAQVGRVELGTPYALYSFADSSFARFAAETDPDPRSYALSPPHYICPFRVDGEERGDFFVTSHRISSYFARGYRSPQMYGKSLPRLLARPELSRFLGQVTANALPPKRFWAYRDRDGRLRLEEIATTAHWAASADRVLIGTVVNRLARAVTIVHAADTLRSREERILYFDACDLDVEKVLKGSHSTTRARVCIKSGDSSTRSDSPYGDSVRVDVGDTRIWLLEKAGPGWSPEAWIVEGNAYVLEMKHLAAVMDFLPDPPPAMLDCPMTRGAAWNADLSGKKGQTVFFLLGMLDEYLGRRFIEDGDKVEGFYCGEPDVADTFYRYLLRLSKEQKLDAKISKKIRQDCLPSFHSPVLAKFINSFYDYTLTNSGMAVTDDGPKMMASADLSADVFEGLDRDVKLAYLAGAYYRYGEGDSFRFANSSGKADLIRDLLTELGCPAERSWREGIPYTHWVRFTPTDELRRWFDEIP